MVTDQQVRRLLKLIKTEKNFGIAAMKAIDKSTALILRSPFRCSGYSPALPYPPEG